MFKSSLRRLAIIVTLGILVAFCSHLVKPPLPLNVLTVYAQSLPVTKALTWTANPASDAVSNYTVRLDATVVGSPVAPTQQVTFTSQGSHNLSVTATNTWGVSSPGTLTVNVVVPGAPGGLNLQ